MIFLKILYAFVIFWNVIRTIAYTLFATMDDPDSVGETNTNLLWAILHAVCVGSLCVAWGIIFG